ncbi:hypothetical protein K431DRAFT_159254 [Polychaeton citri CBS 116435]|uniref:Uncharacterized protein n=1 Tax=Polychaeton citri CBS 116435 TaxID=1314669 RepID=A0A9P4Q3B5_9PEZI|nr:hypothetical protein K431DRAFT_159254 [Polychaeton citri CBS 116435]
MHRCVCRCRCRCSYSYRRRRRRRRRHNACGVPTSIDNLCPIGACSVAPSLRWLSLYHVQTLACVRLDSLSFHPLTAMIADCSVPPIHASRRFVPLGQVPPLSQKGPVAAAGDSANTAADRMGLRGRIPGRGFSFPFPFPLSSSPFPFQIRLTSLFCVSSFEGLHAFWIRWARTVSLWTSRCCTPTSELAVRAHSTRGQPVSGAGYLPADR